MKVRFFILLLPLLISASIYAQDTTCKCRNWIIPRYLNLQYSGGVGNYVVGAGYTLNRSQSLRLVLQYGFTPKYKANVTLHTSSLKFSYYPVRLRVWKGLSIAPDIGIGISRVFADGSGTFTRLPSYYPDGYYAPNAFRVHFNLGGIIRYDLHPRYFVKAVEVYMETTTNDLYVNYYLNYDPIKISDIFSLCLGVNILMGRK